MTGLPIIRQSCYGKGDAKTLVKNCCLGNTFRQNLARIVEGIEKAPNLISQVERLTI